MSKKKKKINVEDETAITLPSMCLQLMNILSHFYPYFKFHLSFEYVKNKVSFEIQYSIEVKSRRFRNYSEFIFRWEGYAALMRPNKVETRLQLLNGLDNVHVFIRQFCIHGRVR